MILDTSAIVAVVLREPEREEFVRKILGARVVAVGAPTLVETGVVLAARRGAEAPARLARVLDQAGVVVISFDRAHWGVAVEAWLRFGRGRHAASLNFGDCLAYATARVAGQPLLAKGGNFAQTDIALA